jgi:hypothetical protein
VYQFANGFIQLLSHDLFITNLATDGCDMIVTSGKYEDERMGEMRRVPAGVS